MDAGGGGGGGGGRGGVAAQPSCRIVWFKTTDLRTDDHYALGSAHKAALQSQAGDECVLHMVNMQDATTHTDAHTHVLKSYPSNRMVDANPPPTHSSVVGCS